MPPKKARKRQGGHGDKHGPVRKTRKTDAGSSPIDNAPSTNRPKNRSCICGDSTCFTLLHIVLDYFLALPHVVFDGKKYPTGDLQWIKNKSSPGLCRFKSKSAHIKQSYLDQFHSLNFPKANLEGKAPYMCLLHFEWNMEHRVKTDILSLDELTKLTEISPALVAKNHGPTTANCKGAFVVVPSQVSTSWYEAKVHD
jgi:hypothetical protein